MMHGEYSSIAALHQIMPTFVPKPYAWGSFERKKPETFFFLMDYLELASDLPDVAKFTTCVADIHRNSKSPTGKFGFHVPVCQGPVVQTTTWDSNWSSYFTKLITDLFHMDVRLNGEWLEYEQAFEALAFHVIPQLLEPLQAKGRILKPCLVHGDLWEENTGTDLITGAPVAFDAAAMYAHNEYEIGMWRREVVRFGRPYISKYLEMYPASEPVEQWDDRNRLYSIKFNLNHTIGWPGSTLIREQ